MDGASRTVPEPRTLGEKNVTPAKCFTTFLLIMLGYQTARADILMASRDTAQILRYDDKTGAFLGIFAHTNAMTNPEALTLGPDGNLYVGDREANSVFRFDGKT